MRKFLWVVFVLSFIALSSASFYKSGMKSGLKKGKLSSQKEQNMSKLDSLPQYPIDPNKPTVKMMIINCGDENPPQMCEVPPIHEVIRERYNIEYVDKDPDILLNEFLPKHKAPDDPKIIKIFYTGEVYLDNDPPKYLDKYDLVMGFDFINAPNYLRLPYQYVALLNKIRHDYDRNMKCNPRKEHFACFLVSNRGDWAKGKFDGAAARTRMFHKLSLYKKVLSGGKHLNNVDGPVSNGEAFLSQCKFTISYENTLNYPGYVTEKPFNAWLAGTVPIYNADPAGLVDINKDAVIYAGDFKNEDELVDYIIKVDNDDDLYCKIWNQQIVPGKDKDYDTLKAQVREKLFKVFDEKLGK